MLKQITAPVVVTIVAALSPFTVAQQTTQSVSANPVALEMQIDGDQWDAGDATQDDSYSVPGNLYPRNVVELAAKESGIVKSVVELGKVLEINEMAFALDDELAKAQLDAAEQELAVAQVEAENDVDLRFANVSTEVNSKVWQRSVAANREYRKAISETEVQRLKLEYERSKLSAEQAELTGRSNAFTEQLKQAQLEMATVQYMNRKVPTPIRGIASEVAAQVGEWVNAGETVVRVVSTDKLRFTGFVDSRNVLPGSINTKAVLNVEVDGEESKVLTRDVTITFINPEIDPASGLYEIRAEVDNSDQALFSGLKSSLEIRRKNP